MNHPRQGIYGNNVTIDTTDLIVPFRLQIRVLGIAQSGAKSRVETQIKLCIQLVTDGGDKAQWWSHLKLPEHMVTKDKLKKTASIASDAINPEKVLYLQARVLCTSDPSKKVTTCYSCIQREVRLPFFNVRVMFLIIQYSAKDLKGENSNNPTHMIQKMKGQMMMRHLLVMNSAFCCLIVQNLLISVLVILSCLRVLHAIADTTMKNWDFGRCYTVQNAI